MVVFQASLNHKILLEKGKYNDILILSVSAIIHYQYCSESQRLMSAAYEHRGSFFKLLFESIFHSVETGALVFISELGQEHR